MRIINLALCMLICTILVGQKYQLTSIQEESIELESTFETYKTYTLNHQNLRSELISQIGSKIQLTSDDFDVELELAPVNLLTHDFQIKAIHADGPKYMSYDEVNTYVAYDKKHPEKQYRFYISENRVQGMFDYKGETFQIESAKKYQKSAHQNQIIVYKPKDVKSDEDDANYSCHLEESESVDDNKEISTENRSSGGCKEVELSIAADYLLFLEQGGIEGVLEELVSILNDVQGDYSVQFDDVVQFKINELLVSCCEECDPWISSTNLFSLLGWFKDWGINNGFERPHDLGLLWTDRVTDGGVVGAAYMNSLCGTNRYSGMRHFTNNPGKLRMMTSHEIGHTFGLPHNYAVNSDCHPSPGRDPLIMDPVVNLAAVAWSTGTEGCVDIDPGDSSVERLNEKLLLSDCFDTECDSGDCIEISNLDVTNIWADYAEVHWTGIASSYTIKLREDMEDNFILEETIDTDYFYLDGTALDAEVRYVISVVSNCGSEESTLRELEFITPILESALPVELIRFEGKKEDTKVALTWETATEINSDHFKLYRSSDGVDYELLSEIRSTGSPNSISNIYEYLDDEARNGLNYYRLEQFDIDGNWERFDDIVVEMRLLAQDQMIRISQNGNGKVGFQVDNGGYDELTVQVFDTSGKVVQSFPINAKDQLFEVDTTNMSTGIYVIQAQSKIKMESLKFFVY